MVNNQLENRVAMLLGSTEFSDSLFKAVNSAEDRVVIASAFIKVDALRKLLKDKGSADINVVARWQKRDLVCGASDLDVYNMCREEGWKFGVSLNLHGKLYCIDRESIYLGSANLTSKGLGFAAHSNFEFGTKIPAREADLNKLDAFFEEEISWIDDETFMQMTREIEQDISSQQTLQDTAWSKEITNKLTSDVKYLWVNELPFCSPKEILALNLNDEFVIHDYDLFGLDIDTLHAHALKTSFKNARVYSWIVSALRESGGLNFGGLSHRLHNSLLNDPKPYRKEVKQLVVTLFSWFDFLDDEFQITKHNYTSSVVLSERSSQEIPSV